MRRFHIFAAIVILAFSSCARSHGNVQEIREVSDISGLRVATVSGSLYEIALTPREDVKKLVLKNTTDCVEALQRGMADVFIYDDDIFTAKDLERQGLKIACLADYDLPTAFGFSKNNKALRESFNCFLSGIRADGTLAAMEEFWRNIDDVSYDEIPKILSFTEGEPLRVGTCIIAAPTSYVKNGEWVGFEVELARRFAAWVNRPVEIFHYDITSLIFGLQKDQVDIMMGSITITEDRQRSVAFSDVYAVKHPALFVRDSYARKNNEGLSDHIKDSINHNLIHEGRWHYLTDGLRETLKLSILSILLGSLLGMLLCAASFSKRKWMREFVSIYELLMRGLPMLVLLLFMFYVVFSGAHINASMVAVIAFSLNFAAGASGVFHSSIESVPKGQTEAGLALGFSRFATFRYVVLPQAIRKAVPGFKSNCIALIKNTSIVGYIAVRDLTKASDMIRSRTFDAFVPLLIISIIYLLLAWIIGKLLDLSVKKL